MGAAASSVDDEIERFCRAAAGAPSDPPSGERGPAAAAAADRVVDENGEVWAAELDDDDYEYEGLDPGAAFTAALSAPNGRNGSSGGSGASSTAAPAPAQHQHQHQQHQQQQVS